MSAIVPPVDCILFDLDDTLYEHASFLRGAFADAAAAADADPALRDALAAAMMDVVRDTGTEGGAIFERALARVNRTADAATLARMAAAFRAHAPTALVPAPGVARTLALLARRYPLGLVTDGEVPVQAAKLAALGIASHFATIVYSDSLGGPPTRKPDPAPYRAALAAIGARAAHSLFVGDHPGRDIAGARALGMTTVRVLTGEHHARIVTPPDEADFVIQRIAELVDLLP